jgi:hypothetical protein
MNLVVIVQVPRNRNDILRPKKRIGRYTLTIFLERAQVVHGDKFDYSNITEADIKGCQSKITVVCRRCRYIWRPSIVNHISGEYGCPSCAGLVRLTLETFIIKAHQLHGDIFEYPGLCAEMIQNNRSRIYIKCIRCLYVWDCIIRNHLNSRKYGCPQCAGNLRWTKNRLLIKAKEIHGDQFDYSLVLEEQILSAYSEITIRCTICDYIWTPNIHNHITGKSGCPQCYGRIGWTLTTFIARAIEIHVALYDYSLITEADVVNQRSHVWIICNKCKRRWCPTITSHINGKRGCPTCRSSKGELACGRYLDSIGIPYLREFIIANLDRKRFDFLFAFEQREYLLEFDGEQHFKVMKHHHKTMNDLLDRKEIDILKTEKALDAGYFIIRIDYTQLDKVATHIAAALKLPSYHRYYFSNTNMYHHIISAMNTHLIRQLTF